MTTETIFRQCITCSIFLLSEKAAKLHAPICKFNTANTFKRRLLRFDYFINMLILLLLNV